MSAERKFPCLVDVKKAAGGSCGAPDDPAPRRRGACCTFVLRIVLTRALQGAFMSQVSESGCVMRDVCVCCLRV